MASYELQSEIIIICKKKLIFFLEIFVNLKFYDLFFNKKIKQKFFVNKLRNFLGCKSATYKNFNFCLQTKNLSFK